MELTERETQALYSYIGRLQKAASVADKGQNNDQIIFREFKRTIGRKKNSNIIDSLTTITSYYLDSDKLLLLIIEILLVSDKMVESLFYDVIAVVTKEERKKILLLLSIHRYVLFEMIVTKTGMLAQLFDYTDSLLIPPAEV